MNDRSLFITFEGGEGAGKTTLIKGLKEVLKAKGHSVLVTREPGGSSLGEQIRLMLLHQRESTTISPLAELLLFLADRAQHIEEVIKPALKIGKIVLCDRYNDSTIAYQGVGRGLGLEKTRELCRNISGDTMPVLTFFLDLKPEAGLKRINGRSRDRMESEHGLFHENVRQGFLTLAKQEPDRIVVLDASKNPEIVLKEALKHLEKKYESI